MEYSCSKSEDGFEVDLIGRLTFDEHTICRKLIGELTADESNNKIINLSKLEFIDSAGLGLLPRIQDACSKSGQTLSLKVPDDGQVQKMLQVARFDQLVPFV